MMKSAFSSVFRKRGFIVLDFGKRPAVQALKLELLFHHIFLDIKHVSYLLDVDIPNAT